MINFPHPHEPLQNLDNLEGMTVGKSVHEITALIETPLTATEQTYTISECNINKINERFSVKRYL